MLAEKTDKLLACILGVHLNKNVHINEFFFFDKLSKKNKKSYSGYLRET